jgi:hypothetical protein
MISRPFSKVIRFPLALTVVLMMGFMAGCVTPSAATSPVTMSAPPVTASAPPTKTVYVTQTPVSPEPSPKIINWRDAGNYLGETKTVEGMIVRTYWASNSNGKPTFLNFNNPYQGYLTLVIWEDNRNKFPADPEKYYLKKNVKVTGLM